MKKTVLTAGNSRKIEHGKLTQWNWVVYRPENLKLGKRRISAFLPLFLSGYGVTIEMRFRLVHIARFIRHQRLMISRAWLFLKKLPDWFA